jgi:enoyl-CoA hydratase/carnithine racemase
MTGHVTAPLSVALSKRFLREGRVLTREEIGARETTAHHAVMGQPDALEGVMSFLERRRPEGKLATGRRF